MVKDKNYEIAKNRILTRFKTSNIICAMRMKDGFLFSIKPKNAKDYVLDAFFKVDNNGNITDYSPVMNPEEFKEAMNNIIT